MRWLVALAVVATIGWNAVAEILPLNDLRTGQISDRFRVYFTPAGYVFSIWSLIYAGLIAYAIHQLRHARARLRDIEVPVLHTCAFNIAWLTVWHYEMFATSMLVMLGLLVSLIWVRRRLARPAPADGRERLFVDGVFSLYLGWVSVATIANLVILLDYAQARPFGVDALAFALAMVILAGVIAIVVGMRTRDAVYVAVFVWAAVGIAVRPGQPRVMILTAAGVAIVLALVLVRLLARRASA